MKGTVGINMMGNTENTNPKIISPSRERRQRESHTSERERKDVIANLTPLCAIN